MSLLLKTDQGTRDNSFTSRKTKEFLPQTVKVQEKVTTSTYELT
ncbi:MAG: hypothetical protein EWM72_00365 [Nitrospira sp.]|nr:MAG: hypothetical protein EWM72_00365 [Nitrospira sp.]